MKNIHIYDYNYKTLLCIIAPTMIPNIDDFIKYKGNIYKVIKKVIDYDNNTFILSVYNGNINF